MTARVLNPDEAAEFLGVSRRWLIREGIHRYGVPHLRPPGGKLILFDEDELRRTKTEWRVDGGNDASQSEQRLKKLADRVVAIVQHDPGLTRAALRRSLTGVNKQRSDEAIDEAIRLRRLRVLRDGRNAQLHYPTRRGK